MDEASVRMILRSSQLQKHEWSRRKNDLALVSDTETWMKQA